jgi:Holliday junction resolvase RusA-like endonuclease
MRQSIKNLELGIKNAEFGSRNAEFGIGEEKRKTSHQQPNTSHRSPITIKILGTPQPKQGDRQRIAKGSSGQFIQHYKSAKVKTMENNIQAQAIAQLPKDFAPFDEPIGIKAKFVFPPLKSFPKYKLERIEGGIRMYKDTKPDLTDNLMKGLCDALEGILYVNDSRICKVETEKVFGRVPRTEVEVYSIQN